MNSTEKREEWWGEAGPDSSAEWDFDPVPDSELIACCLWEYARESKTIKLHSRLHWCHVRHIIHREAYQQDPSLIERHNEDARLIEGWAKDAGFNYDDFGSKFWETDFPLIGIYSAVTELVRDGAHPWQRLNEGVRAFLTRQVSESIVLLPLSMAWVNELEELWNANSVELLDVRSRVRDCNDDSEDAALFTETTAIESPADSDEILREKVTTGLTIDFSRFTDQEITKAFAAWLKENRPKQWKQPRRVFPGAKQRGRKLMEYRVALDRVGLMRLLHLHSPRDLRDELPAAWKKIGSKEPDFRREIREASKFFRGLFPFLPENECPESKERFGVWYPPIRKIMDELDRERGSK